MASSIFYDPSGTQIRLGSGSLITSTTDGIDLLTNAAGTDFTRLQFGGTTNAFPALKRNGTLLDVRLADDSGFAILEANQLVNIGSQITAGSGTGFTLSRNGWLNRSIYMGTVVNTAFTAAALTSDFTLGTLPAKTALLACYCDVTAAFTGLAGSITLMLGVGATPNTIVIAFDVKSAPVTKGLLDADLGTDLTRATAVQGGKVYSFSATTPIVARITSGTGNVGDGAGNSNLTTGAAVIYFITERLA